MTEIWQPIKGWEGYYDVSNLGRIRSYRKNQFFLKEPRIVTLTDSFGYWYVHLQVKKKSKRLRVHRIVAETFIPNPNNYPVIDHIDGDKKNNKVENLKWCTQSENCCNPNTINKHPKHWYKDPITNKRIWY